jgi:D-alanyl-D-alanine carboxypeptidase/D-alanyl-D-alanine-endopeptidase (penicillin-binding protein 4)
VPTELCTAIVIVLAVAALAACGEVRHEPDLPGEDDGGDDGDGAGEPPSEADGFEPAPPPLALPDDVIAAADSEVGGILASSGFTHSLLIENATTGQIVAESNADDLLVPASNTKLFTTAAAMEILGEDHGLTVRVASTSPPDADGIIVGDLHIALEHDFSLSSVLYDDPRQPLDRIAEALAQIGITAVEGTVHVSGEAVFEGDATGTLDVEAERLETADAMADALADAGITTVATADGPALDIPAGAEVMYEHAPIALRVATSPLNSDSNNEFADLLLRHVGWQVEGDSSPGAGATAVLDWLGSTGVPTDGIVLRDGSGLSQENRVSARAIVDLLRFMDESPIGAVWSRTLAIAGVRGTLDSRLLGDDTAGRVFGKSGTLPDAIALSGSLESRHDGQRYLFSILWNQVNDIELARALADQIVEVVARNLRGGGERPAPPQLLFARSGSAPGLLDIAWSDVEGADGYIVWLSEDGRIWPRDQARHVRSNRFAAGDLSAALPTYVRVTARSADGLESDPSAAHAATASGEPAAILLVDGNDVWTSPAPENVLGRNHDFLAGLASSLGERSVASAHHGAIESGDIDLAGHDLILWAAGEESTDTVALSEAEREGLAAHLDAGGALILSGAELLWALVAQGSGDEQAFAADVLGAEYVADAAGTYEAEGTPDGDWAALPLLSFLAPDGMDIDYADVLAPGDGGVELLRYVGGAGGSAAIGHPRSSGRRVVVTGFPIESIPSGQTRAAILEAALRFLE